MRSRRSSVPLHDRTLAIVGIGAALLGVLGAAGRLADRSWGVAATVAGVVVAAVALFGWLRLVPAGRRSALRLAVAAIGSSVAVRIVTSWIDAADDSWRRVIADGLTFGWVHRGPSGVVWQRTLGVAALVAVVVSLTRTKRGRAEPDGDGRGWRLFGGIALVGLLWTQTIVDLVARQYVERITMIDGRRAYIGPLSPVLLWSMVVVGACAVVTTVVLVVPLLSMAGTTRPKRPSFGTLAATIVAGSLLWRLTALLNIAPTRTDGGDPLYYHTQANTLAHGLGFIEPLHWIADGARIPTALHGPGYPLYLSLFTRLGASAWFDNRLASSLIGAASVLLAIILGRRLAGAAAGLLAGVFACFYANMWTIDGVLFPEGLFIFCCGLAIVMAYRWSDHRRALDAIVLGLAIGVAALTRGEGIVLLVLLAGPLCWLVRRPSWTAALRSFGLITIATLVVIGPWMIRNATTFASFVPLSTNSNELHVYSNCDDTYRGPLLGFWSYQCQQRLRDTNGDGVPDFDPPGDESQQKRFWQEVGFRYAREHLGELPKVVAARVLRQWDLFRPLQNARLAFIEGRSPTWARVALFQYYALVLAGIAGVWSLRRRRVMVFPLLAQFVLVTLTAAYAYGTTRFRAPAELALCVLAAVGVVAIAGRWSPRRRVVA